MTTFWQRVGRGARDPRLEATAILFAEAKHFDDEVRRIEENNRKRQIRAHTKKQENKKMHGSKSRTV